MFCCCMDVVFVLESALYVGKVPSCLSEVLRLLRVIITSVAVLSSQAQERRVQKS